MTIFTDLVNDVITLTSRPDLLAETQLAIRASTLKAHHSDFFPRDIVEKGIQFDNEAFLQDLRYRELFPDWRKIRYLRKYGDAQPGLFLELVAPEDSIDYYNAVRQDVAYFAGDVLHIRSSTDDATYLVGYFRHPIAIETGYDSWIATEMPFAIVYDAAATIFHTIGQQEKSGVFMQKVAEFYRELKINYISETGY